MRTAFLPVFILLAGGLAWGQTTGGASAQSKTRTDAPVVAPRTQLTSAPSTILKLQNELTLTAAQIELTRRARLKAPQTERPAASGPEQIPTQWPHAKLEPIPTQWKAQVILVGGAAARPAEKPAGKDAGAVVRPK
jgi:hypothetical protein